MFEAEVAPPALHTHFLPCDPSLFLLSAANAVTIYDLAASTRDLSILVEAAQAANLTDPLMDPDTELTVFAPVDAAFEELLGVLEIPAEDLLADPETLAAILKCKWVLR